MNIDLSQLSYKDKIDIDIDVIYDEEFLKGSKILGLEGVHAKGNIYQNSLDDIVIKLDVSGKMYLEDCITLNKIPKDFQFEIDDIYEQSMTNNQNTLDIMEFLWQNIVLEVPIRYTLSDAQDLKGDNWEVLNEYDAKEEIDPRLQKLCEYNKGGE